MTKEEAINYLQECSKAIGNTEHHTLSYAKEALNMAIKALSQQTEDAISRQAAINATCAECSYVNCRYRDNDVKHASCNYVDRLKQLPSVHAVPKTGHWIECDNGCGDIYYKCSVCNSSWCDALGNLWKEEMRYCPNCGAQMESEE